MSDKSNQLFDTADGSSSIISGRFGEAYHSRHGAIQESNHVFIDAGLKHLYEQGLSKIRILEIGFGTGLNAYLSYLETQNNVQLEVDYHGIEAYPISDIEYQSLNFHNQLDTDQGEFLTLHTSPWEESISYSNSFRMIKLKMTFEEFESSSKYDLIYFDAFAPSIQAHLWEEPFLRKIYGLCEDNAVLVTYCAKGSFKRALKAVGFKIESIPGPAKKREMTRAIKSPA